MRRRRWQDGDELESWQIPAVDPICPLCSRPIPKAQRDAHHLIPKLKGGRETVDLHRICHRQIHALLNESELARAYATIEALRAHPEIEKFIAWVAGKPPDFCDGAKTSRRMRNEAAMRRRS